MPPKKLKGADHIYERISVDGRLTSVLFVSKDLSPATMDAGYWSYELVAEAAAGNYKSRAYLQRAPDC